jgi:hypothetical protein
MDINPAKSSGGEVDFLPAVVRDESEFKQDQNPRIVLPEHYTKADAVFHLAQKTPTNEFGLPTWFYRSDLLPDLRYLRKADVENSAEGLFYYDGFPVTQYGSSFWQQLPHEPLDHYILFGKFLDQAMEVGIRQLDLLSASVDKDLEQLQQYYREFYWGARARAYDLFITAAERKRREHITRKMENTHYEQAGKLLAVLQKKFEDAEWFQELNAKEAIEAMETLVKLQRLSVGLTGQHSSSNEGMPRTPGMSAEVILRQITQGAGMSDGTANAMSRKIEELLQDPEAGMKLQEIILKVTTNENQQVEY